MQTFIEILSPGFLLRNAVWTSLLIGLACPLVGVFFVLRRLIFMGVAMPQISSTGVAVALTLHVWFGHYHGPHDPTERLLAFAGSVTFSLLAVLWLAFLERRGRGLVEGRLGTAYVVSAAVSILLLAKCPQAERGWMNLFKGEIITISSADLGLTLATFTVVLFLLWLFNKEFLLVSFDREMAITLRKNVAGWDLLLYLLMGLAISIAVLSVGPLISFGFLLIPPLIARLFANTMRQFALLASAIGGVGALLGFVLAYHWDLPAGPTDVALLGVFYAIAFFAAKWRRSRHQPEISSEQSSPAA
ncbi:MAG TPA: metal ABC transporter permease [Methylomirabilota bacterium]|nr:metal ABC transporter permease [Methylomirabilota bacterium]